MKAEKSILRVNISFSPSSKCNLLHYNGTKKTKKLHGRCEQWGQWKILKFSIMKLLMEGAHGSSEPKY